MTADSVGPNDIPVTDIGPSRPLTDVLAARHSSRAFAPPAAELVVAAMARAGLARISSEGDCGIIIGSRPAPSAGGRHPITLVLLANSVIGLESGAWVLDPDRAALRPARYTQRAVNVALEAVAAALREELPPAAIFAVAQPDRTLSRYPRGASLLWREAGALLATLDLAATDLGLATCFTGTCDVLRDDRLESDFIDLGCLAVGRSLADIA